MRLKLILSLGVVAILSTSCSDEIDSQADRGNKYLHEFIQSFGVPDKGHTYNMVAAASADIAVSDPAAKKVRLLTAFPGNDESRLLAERPVAKGGFSFDIYQGASSVYVQLLDADGKVLSGRYADVRNGHVLVTDAVQSRAATIGTATRGSDIVSSLGNTQTSSENAEEIGGTGPIKEKLMHEIYRLSGDYSRESNTLFSLGDILRLVGPGAIFEESYYEGGKCILERYADAFKATQGVEFTTNSETEIIINYIYGNTQKSNTLGYFYYPEGATKVQIAQSAKYVLIDDATPTNYNKYNGNGLSTVVSGIMSNETADHKVSADYINNQGFNLDTKITTTEFQLTYFDEEGVPHEKFPAGYHIAFFLIMGNNNDVTAESNWDNSVRFSLVWMNSHLPDWMVHETCPSGPSHKHDDVTLSPCSFSGKRPSINFITYQWGDKTLVGIEDQGGDDDMNDLVFYVSGDFDKSNITQITDDGSQVRPQGCLLAVEDLGASYDWDFNDLVVGVSAQDTEDGKTVRVDPLAAGGTLPIRLMYTQGDKKYFVGPEFHSWFGVSTSVMVNTGAKATQPSTYVTFDAPSTFSMAPNTGEQSNMGGFWVLVDKENNYASYAEFSLMEAPDEIEGTIIPAPVNLNKDENMTVPYMLCLGDEWHWAREQKHIDEAYDGGFASWVQNKSYNWYNSGHTNLIDINLITLKPGDTSAASVIGPLK